MLDSWDQFYQDKYPEKVKRELHIVLGGELKVLLKFLEPTTRKGHKALELSGQPKVIIVLRILRNMKLLTNRNSESADLGHQYLIVKLYSYPKVLKKNGVPLK
ncbi:unnamed protein product [Rhizophagus irregularis]|nr:unnamed protein product [Rhizophagus irregularis]CAB5313708.1 unnamed protein product [Rhizophagus irregularis]